MPDTRSPDGPDDGADATLLGEILSLPPRLASRTIAQVQASQHLLSMLVCSGQADRSEDSGASGQGPTAHDGERHDTAEQGSAEPSSAEHGSGEPLAERFELPAIPAVTPRYNLAPSQPVGVIRVAAEGQRA